MKIWLEQASHGAVEVDQVLIVLLLICGFFLLVTAGPILIFAFRYRRSNPVNRVIRRKNTLALELAWTLLPLGLGIGLFAHSAAVYFRQRHAPADAMEIHVIGHQWMWMAQHPNGKREINSLHVPLGVPTRLILATQDVIHSFFIPAFRVKQDAVPGYFTTLWFTPTKEGVYSLFCAEYCGTEHARMIGSVTVMSRADYQAWLQTGQQEESPVSVGARLYHSLGCSGCHEAGGSVRAPSLHRLYGSVVPLERGKTRIADEQYLRDTILLPNLDVTAGYEPVMPSYQGRLTEGELLALIAYLKNLPRETPPDLP